MMNRVSITLWVGVGAFYMLLMLLFWLCSIPFRIMYGCAVKIDDRISDFLMVKLEKYEDKE